MTGREAGAGPPGGTGQGLRLIAADGGRLDSVERRRRFEERHAEVTIVPPGSRWRAVVPLGKVPGNPDGTMIGAQDLEGLMDQLDRIYPPEEHPG